MSTAFRQAPQKDGYVVTAVGAAAGAVVLGVSLGIAGYLIGLSHFPPEPEDCGTLGECVAMDKRFWAGFVPAYLGYRLGAAVGGASLLYLRGYARSLQTGSIAFGLVLIADMICIALVLLWLGAWTAGVPGWILVPLSLGSLLGPWVTPVAASVIARRRVINAL